MTLTKAFDREGHEISGTRRGVTLADSYESEPETEERHAVDYLSFGGWLNESAFGVEVVVIGGYALNT